jgi:hypothetical protein
MSFGREGAICEYTIDMQISPVRAMKAVLIAASRGFCKLVLSFPGRSAARRLFGGVVRCKAGAGPSTILSSCAGLTRASIPLQKTLSKKMDGRVKPGHDGPEKLRNIGLTPLEPGAARFILFQLGFDARPKLG